MLTCWKFCILLTNKFYLNLFEYKSIYFIHKITIYLTINIRIHLDVDFLTSFAIIEWWLSGRCFFSKTHMFLRNKFRNTIDICRCIRHTNRGFRKWCLDSNCSWDIHLHSRHPNLNKMIIYLGPNSGQYWKTLVICRLLHLLARHFSPHNWFS